MTADICSHCDGEFKDYSKLSCHGCGDSWHAACAGLTGITPGALNKILQWRCPLCLLCEGKEPIENILARIARIERELVEIKTTRHLTVPVNTAERTDSTAEHADNTAERADNTGERADNAAEHADNTTVQIITDTAPLHKQDVLRATKLTDMMKNSRQLLSRASRVVIGDSNMKEVARNRDLQLDISRTTCVLACGGLCTVAAAQGLKDHAETYTRVTKVILAVSTNDALHPHQHCMDDREKHLKKLEQEIKRMFPRAKIHFLVPFSGMKEVPNTHIDAMGRAVKSATHMTVHTPPNMSGKIKPDGVHLTWDGKVAFTDYLTKAFVPAKLRPVYNDQSHPVYNGQSHRDSRGVKSSNNSRDREARVDSPAWGSQYTQQTSSMQARDYAGRKKTRASHDPSHASYDQQFPVLTPQYPDLIVEEVLRRLVGSLRGQARTGQLSY